MFKLEYNKKSLVPLEELPQGHAFMPRYIDEIAIKLEGGKYTYLQGDQAGVIFSGSGGVFPS